MSWKARLRRVINSGLEPAGFTLQRFQPEIHSRAMESEAVRDRQIVAYREAMKLALSEYPELSKNIPGKKETEVFIRNLVTCPVNQVSGGGGFSAAVLLWTLGKAISPEMVVESGVFRGFTTWVLRQACPDAQQYAFDISFAERKRVEAGVKYHETDWVNIPVVADSSTRSLAYFDDHVDQWRRIREAAERGFR